MVLGLAARLLRYLLRFPLWNDECFLASNLLERGYVDLARPLDYAQVCPILFLWVQLTAVRLLGFSEMSLRLFPLLCGLGGLLLFRDMAARLTRGVGEVLAVAVFAVAYPAIRYAAEAKPYGSDLFVALGLLAIAVRWLLRPDQQRWGWWLAVVAPIALALSYPAVFIAGAISVAAALGLLQAGFRRGWLPWVAYNTVLAASFALVYLLVGRTQYLETRGLMLPFWQDAFPPLDRPWRLPAWLLAAHTGVLLAHPVGGAHAGSTLTLVACAAGVIVLVRRRQAPVLALCLVPLGLNFIAAAMHRYPYGGYVRMAMYFAPICCLLAGIGLAGLLAWYGRRRPGASIGLRATLGLLALLGLGCMARDLWRQAKSQDDMRARDFARWFWPTAARDGEVACLWTDLRERFSPKSFACGYLSVYLCNQRIYSPRHARGEPVRWDRLSREWPLRCVEYRPARPGTGYDEKGLAAWLQRMQSAYSLVGRERFLFVYGNPAKRPEHRDWLEIYTFVPKPAGPEGPAR